jgi:hypothetical protein
VQMKKLYDELGLFLKASVVKVRPVLAKLRKKSRTKATLNTPFKTGASAMCLLPHILSEDR